MTTRPGTAIWLGTLLAAAIAQGADAPNSAAVATPPAGALIDNAVAGIVNGDIITMVQIQKAISDNAVRLAEAMGNRFPDDPDTARKEFHAGLLVMEKEMLHTLVDRQLIIQEFNGNPEKYFIPQSVLDRQFDDSITTRFQGDHQKFLNFLAAKNMTETDYRKQLKEEDIYQGMMNQLHSTATGISPDRIKAYYEKNQPAYNVRESVRVRQIVLTPVADEPAQVIQQQAVKIIEQARQPGANFVALAQQYSTDNAARSADQPTYTFTRDEKNVLTPVEAAAPKLTPGEVSDPIVSGATIYIFKCEEKTPAGVQPLEKVRTDIEVKLTEEDTRQAEEKWLQRLRSKAYILYNL